MTQCETSSEFLEMYGFVYGDVHVPYRVQRIKAVAGKRRKVSIRVHPDTQVIVRAPQDAQNHDIHDAVMKRAKWIYNALQGFNEQRAHVQPRRYVSGEMQFYLGRRYVLKIVLDPATTPQVKMERGTLLVSLPDDQTYSGTDKADRARELVRQWYRTRAQHIFKARLEQLVPGVRWVNAIPEYRILSMTRQWGSCSARGTLMLNPHLVKTPRDCIDYVILHELCHIEEHNHSERFYRLLGQVMPEWRGVKQRLDGMAELVLNE